MSFVRFRRKIDANIDAANPNRISHPQTQQNWSISSLTSSTNYRRTHFSIVQRPGRNGSTVVSTDHFDWPFPASLYRTKNPAAIPEERRTYLPRVGSRRPNTSYGSAWRRRQYLDFKPCYLSSSIASTMASFNALSCCCPWPPEQLQRCG